MPRPTSFDRVCCPKAMIACHARRRPTLCAVQRRRYHASPDDAVRVCCPRALMSCHARHCRPCVQSKGGNFMPCPTLTTVCLSKGVDFMPRLTLPTVCAVQGRRWHVTPNVIRPCVLSKGGDGMPRPTSFVRVCHQRAMMAYDARRRLTLSATSRSMMACHARCRPTVYVAQRQRWHATPDVVQPCV